MALVSDLELLAAVGSRVSQQIDESRPRGASLEQVQKSVNDAILAEFLEGASRVPQGTREPRR